MFGSWEIFKAYGIPIRLHASLLLIPLILPAFSLDILVVAALLLVYVLLHELGHAVAALRHHYPVDQILLTPIGGVAMIRMLPGRHLDELRIALAGPLVSLALAGGSGLLAGAFSLAGLSSAAFLVMALGAAPNLAFFLFNLLPAFPMDGGRVLRALLTPRMGILEATERASRVGRILAGALALYGLLSNQMRLVLIGGFIYWAAGQEYRVLKLRRRVENLFGAGASAPDLTIGPPPYESSSMRTLGREIRYTAILLRDELERLILGRSMLTPPKA